MARRIVNRIQLEAVPMIHPFQVRFYIFNHPNNKVKGSLCVCLYRSISDLEASSDGTARFYKVDGKFFSFSLSEFVNH